MLLLGLSRVKTEGVEWSKVRQDDILSHEFVTQRSSLWSKRFEDGREHVRRIYAALFLSHARLRVRRKS